MKAATNPSNASEELYRQREQRLIDAIALRVPDRPPVIFFSTFWHAKYGGRTIRDIMYDCDLNAELLRKAVLDLQPDGVMPVLTFTAFGRLLELIDFRRLKWPGHGVADNHTYQFLDQELMRADEYDSFLEDPSYFYLTRYLPQVAGAFEPFARFPHFPSYFVQTVLLSANFFADPQVVDGFARLAKAGTELQRLLMRADRLREELDSFGFPTVLGGVATAPFDYFADSLRGSKGAMLDMLRKKDRLLEAMDRITPMLIRSAVEASSHGPSNIVFIPLHWGLDGFMSPVQFNTFFWPQLRQLIMGLIEHDLVPCVLWEGDCTSRLETIADIPRGKAIYMFERTDLFRAKQVLGQVVCLRGNVPASLLVTGTPEEVTVYCRRLIKEIGKDGGLILDGAIGIPDEARPENVRAMFRSVQG